MIRPTVVYLSSISAIACAGALVALLRLKNQHARSRLFWRQMVMLVATDLVWALLGAVIYAIAHISSEICLHSVYVRYALEFSSCFLEVQIAAGFAAACKHSTYVTRCLKIVVPLSCPLCILVVLLMIISGLPSRLNNEHSLDYIGHLCDPQHGLIWGSIVLSLCFAALILYGAGIMWSSKAPAIVRSRALVRAFCYVLNFLGTYGVRALQMLSTRHSDTWDEIALGALCLNGLFNVATYLFQNCFWSKRVPELELQAHSYHPDFCSTVDEVDVHFDLQEDTL